MGSREQAPIRQHRPAPGRTARRNLYVPGHRDDEWSRALAPCDANRWNRPPVSTRNRLCKSRSAPKVRQDKWTSRHRGAAGDEHSLPAWQCAPVRPFRERANNRCNRIRGWCPLQAHPARTLPRLEGKVGGSRLARWSFPDARPNPGRAAGQAPERRRLLLPFWRMRPSVLPPERNLKLACSAGFYRQH